MASGDPADTDGRPKPSGKKKKKLSQREQSERFVETAHRVGLQVHVWTIDDEAEMHELLDLGVDGLMTDRPRVLKDVLVSRGAWY